MPIRKQLDQAFFKIWTPQMAYALGYFAADGSMIRNKRGGQYVEFTSTDLILLRQLKHVTGASHCVSRRPLRSPYCKQSYRLQIGSTSWYTDLSKLGFTPRKSNTLLFPTGLPRELLGDFVRGYFDGDGCVYFKRLRYADRKRMRWVLMTLFTSGSGAFLKTLHSILRNYGIRGGSLVPKTRGFELKFSHRDSLALYRLMYHTAKASHLFLPRKRRKLERAFRVLELGEENAVVA